MTQNDVLDVWRSILGESDDEDETVCEGLNTLGTGHVGDGGESDIDPDIVVDNDRLLEMIEEEDGSDGDDVDIKRKNSEENDVTLSQMEYGHDEKQKRRTRKARAKVVPQWSKETKEVKLPKTFDNENVKAGVHHDLLVDADPYDYFSLIVPESFWTMLSDETNLYAEQKQAVKGEDKNWQETTPEEMKLFIFIQFMFGVVRLPQVCLYWSTNPLLRIPAVADVMSKIRFDKLSQYFHLNDSSEAVPKGKDGYDPLFKVRPLLDMVQHNSKKYYYPGQDISIDEALIKFNGHLSFKQHTKGKSNHWGIKVWCAADPRSGYMLDFDIYHGRTKDPIPYGLGYHVVMKMSEDYLNKGHHLYFNHFFSSVKLGQDLEEKGTYMCLTIKLTRPGWPKELNEHLAKRMKVRDVRFMQDGNMVATLWKDRKAVTLLSTNSQPKMGTGRRAAAEGKKDILVPRPVLNYNNSRGGVNLATQHHSYYPVGRPSTRWWRYICWWLLQTAMVNAYIIWKHSHLPAPNKRGHYHLDFRMSVLQSLCQGRTIRQKGPREAVSLAGLTSRDPLSHDQERLPGRKKSCFVCKRKQLCTTKGYSVTTVWGCSVCRVHLCKGECFAEFHLVLANKVR